MATKTATTTEAATTEQDADASLLDVQSAAVKRLIARGRERGYITFDELNAVLPPDQMSSEQIEDVMAVLSEMGIQVVENEDNEEAEPAHQDDEDDKKEKPDTDEGDAPSGNVDAESLGRTDDPVRMYLREMGSVELLSREGEIAIAKRIEAGREAMIAGLCESPLTFQAIIIWRDELNEAKVLLREIIDLEATYAGPDGKNTPKIDMTAPDAHELLAARNNAAPSTAPRNPPPGLDDVPMPEENFDDEDDMENSVSLSAMEAELKPKVL